MTVEIPVLKKKEEERRGGAVPPPFLLRTSGIQLVAGAPRVTGFGLGSLFWGLNGRGGLLALARVALQGMLAMFSRGELTVLGAAILATLALSVMGLSQAIDLKGERRQTWSFDARQDSPAPTTPFDADRPALGTLIKADVAAQAQPAERPNAEAPAAKEEPQAPEPAPGDSTAEAQAIVESVLARTPVKLVPGSLARGTSGRYSGEGLRDSVGSFMGTKSFGTLPPMKDLGRLTAAPKAAARRAATRFSAQLGARSSRAMGQLKFARNRSMTALGATAMEPTRNYAAQAFDQSQSASAGESIGGSGLSGGEVMGPIGSGAPDLTAPSVGPSENKTPYQDKVDKAKQGINMAIVLVMLGLALLAMGAMVMIYAKSMMAAPDPTGASKIMGAKLMMMGKILLVAGAAAVAAGIAAAMMAKGKGKDVADDYGQEDQGRVIDSCSGQAIRPKRCAAPNVQQPGNSVHEDVTAESTAGYAMDNGAPVAQ